MVRELIILGTGVHGLEMAEIVERINREKKRWRLLGFVAAEEGAAGREHGGHRILGTAEVIDKYGDADLVCDNEWPGTIAVPHERLVSMVDPSVFVSETASIGRGCVVYPHSYIGHNARVGDRVFCLAGCIINHDDIIEERNVLASAVTLAGGVHVESDCYLGQSCTVRQHLRIGRGSLIGMGAVVVKDVEPNSVMAGNPARRLRERN